MWSNESIIIIICIRRGECVCHSTCFFFPIRFFFLHVFNVRRTDQQRIVLTREWYSHWKSVPTRATSDLLSVRGTNASIYFMNIFRIFIKWFFSISSWIRIVFFLYFFCFLFWLNVHVNAKCEGVHTMSDLICFVFCASEWNLSQCSQMTLGLNR